MSELSHCTEEILFGVRMCGNKGIISG